MATITDCGDVLTPTEHVAGFTRGFAAVYGVVPTNSGPSAPPGGGTGTGISTRPSRDQIWPRGDGVPRGN